MREVKATPRSPNLQVENPPKRQRILEGMLEAVGAEGYETASVRTVLDRTGLYRQAFYDNFADKDACYRAALEMGIERMEAVVARGAAGEKTWRGKLCGGLGALLELLEAEPDFGRGIVVEVHAAGQEASMIRSEAMKRAADFIDLARGEAGEPESPPQIAAEGVVAGIHAIVHSRLSNGATRDLCELLPQFTHFALLPYFGAEAAVAEMQAVKAQLG